MNSNYITDFIRETKERASMIPNFNKKFVEKSFKVLPLLDEKEQKETMYEINSVIDAAYASVVNSKNPLLYNISDELVGGVIDLGTIYVGDKPTGRCLVNVNDLIQTCLTASPGKGKTRLLFTLVREIIKLNGSNKSKISQIILDRRKDFRKVGPEVVVLSLEKIGIAFFEAPPSCDPRRWISDVCQLLMSIWMVYQRSRNNLLKVVLNLYESKQKPPTLLEVYEAIKDEETGSRRMSQRKLEVNEVNLDRIENMIYEFGKCVSTRKSFPLWEILDSEIALVIEADLSNDSFSLLLGWILLYIHRYRKSNNLRGNVAEDGTVVICDEAFLLWEVSRMYSESRRDLGADFIATAPLQLRDFRCAIVAASQRPLSPDFMATTNLKGVGYCGDFEDAAYLANSLGNPKLVTKIPELDVGKFIVKIGDKKTALLQTEDYQVQDVDDEELEKRMKPFYDYIYEFCKDDEPEAELASTIDRVRLSRDAKMLVLDVAQHPESTISARYSRLGLKGRKAQDVVEEATVAKYVDLVEAAIEGSKAAKYLVLTQQAIDWLKSEGKPVVHLQHIGKVSPLHALYQNILLVYLKRSGYVVKHDFAVGDKFADVLAEKDGEKTVYEIAISEAVDASRVASALKHVQSYIFLCKDLVVANTIRLQLSSIGDAKIRYFVAGQYMSNLKKSVLDYYSYNHENTHNSENKQSSDSDDVEQRENRCNN